MEVIIVVKRIRRNIIEGKKIGEWEWKILVEVEIIRITYILKRWEYFWSHFEWKEGNSEKY